LKAFARLSQAKEAVRLSWSLLDSKEELSSGRSSCTSGRVYPRRRRGVSQWTNILEMNPERMK
jgi:hypothetical protein